MAEREGFEPPDLLQSMVFKTTAFDHSAISPGAKVKPCIHSAKNIFKFTSNYLQSVDNAMAGQKTSAIGIMFYLRIMSNNLQVFATKNNDFTLYNPELDETYHSRNGAIAESLHVFIKEGLSYYTQLHPHKETIKILEIGFGTGLNAILSLAETTNKPYQLQYDSLETHILPLELVLSLNYHQLIDPSLINHFNHMHECTWDSSHLIAPHFTLTKRHIGLQHFQIENAYDIIYFDAFAPEKQPEMWTLEALGVAARALIAGGVLVTYSSKGEVKRTLRALGLEVERLPGPPFKRHMLRATKPIEP